MKSANVVMRSAKPKKKAFPVLPTNKGLAKKYNPIFVDWVEALQNPTYSLTTSLHQVAKVLLWADF